VRSATAEAVILALNALRIPMTSIRMARIRMARIKAVAIKIALTIQRHGGVNVGDDLAG